MAVNPDTVPTQLIHTSGPVATPADYKVPGSQEIQLSSVSAHFDGGGASGDFDATLSIYSQDGQLLSRTKAGPTVAAGASGVATWVPFLRAPQTTSGNNFRLWWEGALGDDTTGGVHNIPSGVDTILTGNQQAGPSPLNASVPISFAGAAANYQVVRCSVNPSPPAGQGANAYLFRLGLLWPGVPSDYRYIRLGFSTPGSGMVSLLGFPSLPNLTPKNETSMSQYQELLCLVPPFVFNTADYVDVSPYAFQSSGADQFPEWQLDVYSVQTA